MSERRAASVKLWADARAVLLALGVDVCGFGCEKIGRAIARRECWRWNNRRWSDCVARVQAFVLKNAQLLPGDVQVLKAPRKRRGDAPPVDSGRAASRAAFPFRPLKGYLQPALERMHARPALGCSVIVGVRREKVE